MSPNARSLADSFPELQALADAVNGRDLMPDGELVAYDANGKHCFEKMLERAGRFGRPGKRASTVPIAYQAFDVLRLDGVDLCGRSYQERRRILEGL